MEAVIRRLAAFLSLYGAALFSGLLLALSFPNFFHPGFFPLGAWIAWICLVPLFITLERESPAMAFRKGLAAGFLFFVLSTTWINNIGPMGAGALPAWICLSLYLGLYPAAFAWGVAWARGRGWKWEALWIPALWTLLEFLREHLLTGFPWVSLGSSQVLCGIWLPLAAVTGVYGLHFVVVLINLCFFWIMLRRREALGALGLLALLFLLRLAAPRPQQAGPGLKVAVFQANINQDQPWTDAYCNNLMGVYETMMKQAVAAGAKLLVWPESGFPGFFNDHDPDAQMLMSFAHDHDVDLLVGSTLEVNGGAAYSNAAVFIEPSGAVSYYVKRHLVPFGEYIPFRSMIPLLDRAMDQFGLADFRPGPRIQPGFLAQGLKVEPMVCYESIYGEMARQSSAEANLLAVITLDTWFGDSAAPRYHFMQAMLRAVEDGIWVARAAATGISGFVGPDGSALEMVPLNHQGWVMQEIPEFTPPPTPYRVHGPWFLWLCGLILMGTGLAGCMGTNGKH